MEESRRKTQLSKNLLQMKFMKRTALRSEENEIQQQRKYEEDAEHWTVPDLGRAEKWVVVEPSYQVFENLRYGRMSFKGFNPAIEKMTPSNEVVLDTIDKTEKLMEVSDDEMTERYNSLIHTMNRKFAKKSERTKAERVSRSQRKRQTKWSKMADREATGTVDEGQERVEGPECVQKGPECVQKGPECVQKGPECEEEPECVDEKPPRRQANKLKRKFKKPSD